LDEIKYLNAYDLVIIGAGFTGLTAGLNASKKGKRVLMIEEESSVGGLASSFKFSDNTEVEKYYHHWFSHDEYILDLADEINISHKILTLPSKTGMYYNKRIWDLSSPKDLLLFKPLKFFDRIRLGFLVFLVHLVRDWKKIEHLSIRDWLEPLVGKRVYELVWAPLVNAKFSAFSEEVSAVWMWKKLALRGSTRSRNGKETLLYMDGGFSNFANSICDEFKFNGGEIIFNSTVEKCGIENNIIKKVILSDGNEIYAEKFLFTPSLSIISSIFKDTIHKEWLHQISSIQYLANICLVLRLKKSLSETYWINVNDPGFPFVGVIEHTNLDTHNNYNGSHIAYLSKYLSASDKTWSMSDEEYFNYAIPFIKKMFQDFDTDNIKEWNVWRTRFAQPVTTKNYSLKIPSRKTPFENAWIATMAQIYPEDRGTNYAIREGKEVVKEIFKN